MRDAPCPSCGAKVGRGSATCPSCGAALDLRVEALASEPGDVSEVELGRTRPRWWAAVVVVGAVGLVGAGAVVAGGDATRAVDTTTTTTSTTVPSTTAARPTSTSEAPSTTTSTLPPRTTVAGAPFLEVDTPPAAVLYGLSRRQDSLWRVDLRTGDATIRHLEVRGGDPDRYGAPPPPSLLPRAGGVVLASWDAPARFVPDDPELPIRTLGGGSVWPLAHADPSLVWLMPQVLARRAQVVDLEGSVVAGPIDLPAGYPIGDDGAGRLLTVVGDSVYAVGLDGIATRLAGASLTAWGTDRSVAMECADNEVRCDLVARSRPAGDEIGRSVAPWPVVESGNSVGALSPSGSTIATVAYGSSGSVLVLLHFDGREPRSYAFAAGPWGGPLGPTRPPVWWLDDTLLCGVEEPGGVRCWRDGDLQATFQLGMISPDGFSSVAFTRG